MKHLLYLLLICFALSSSSCKRDYPSDIPGWLKDRILSLKRTGKSHPFMACNISSGGLRIYEYKVNSTGDIVYCFSETYGYTYLDAQGNTLCNTYMGSPSCSSCICSSGSGMTKLRTVWEASHCH